MLTLYKELYGKYSGVGYSNRVKIAGLDWVHIQSSIYVGADKSGFKWN